MRIAWLKMPEKKIARGKADEEQESGDVGAFMAMEGVQSNWKGEPPWLPEKIMQMVEEAKRATKQ